MPIPRLSLLLALIGATAAVGLFAAPPAAAQPSNSEQVVFSTSGASSASLGQFAFWIWCEADSNNPYQGECNGSMLFNSLGTGKHVVDGSITEGPEGIYTINVLSSDGSINCTLTNTAPAVNGPNNTINVSCSSPSGSATVTGAVVNVTGPS